MQLAFGRNKEINIILENKDNKNCEVDQMIRYQEGREVRKDKQR